MSLPSSYARTIQNQSSVRYTLPSVKISQTLTGRTILATAYYLGTPRSADIALMPQYRSEWHKIIDTTFFLSSSAGFHLGFHAVQGEYVLRNRTRSTESQNIYYRRASYRSSCLPVCERGISTVMAEGSVRGESLTCTYIHAWSSVIILPGYIRIAGANHGIFPFANVRIMHVRH